MGGRDFVSHMQGVGRAGQDWGTDWLRDALGTQALFCALLS